MLSNNFRALARVLQPYLSDTYDLLAAADAVEALLPDLLREPAPEAVTLTAHDKRVLRALGSDEVIDALRDGKKISAIKALRGIDPTTSLKEAKDAVEDPRVARFFVRTWLDHHDADEPPF